MLSFGIISSSAATGGGVTSWTQYAPTGLDYFRVAFAPSGTAAGFRESGTSTASFYASNVETALTDAGATTATRNVYYVNDAFYQVGAPGVRRILRSTTGTSWTSVLNTAQTGDSIYGIAYGNGVYVAPVTTDNDVYTSTTGTAWTERAAVLVSANWSDATWNGSVFGVYAADRATAGTTAYYTSTNGTTWTARTLPSIPKSNFAVGSGVIMYVAGNGGSVYTSTTGTSFSLVGTAGLTTNLAYGSGIWVALSGNNGVAFNAKYSSDNGVTWSSAPFSTGGTAGNNFDLAFNPANSSFYILNDAGSTTDVYKATVTS